MYVNILFVNILFVCVRARASARSLIGSFIIVTGIKVLYVASLFHFFAYDFVFIQMSKV